MLYKHMILDDVGVTKKIWSDYILVTFWLHIMVYGYTESDVIAESRGWNAMSGDNDVVCVLWICVVVGTESYVCDQLPKLPEEPPPIGDCAHNLRGNVATKEGEFRGQVAARLRRKKNGGSKDLVEVRLWLAFGMRRVLARTTRSTRMTKAMTSSSSRRPRAKPTAWRL
jgi:hypothetical protein